MLLNDLERGIKQMRVMLLQTSSKSLEMYLYDYLRESFSSNRDTVLQINSKRDFRRLKEIYNIQPPYSEKWLVQIDLGKIGKSYKELAEIISDSTTVCYMCVAETYVQYKSFKEAVSHIEGVFDFYINILRRRDFLYLYKKLVPSDCTLSKTLYDYVVQSYSADIGAVFDLFTSLRNGIKFNTRADIAEVCGVGRNSVESFVFAMLKNLPVTEKGLKKVIKNRISAGVELAEVYNWGRFNKAVNLCLSALLDIKKLQVSGVVYKRLTNLPEGYDERRLSKYQRYLWRIETIPLSRILRLKVCFSNRWFNKVDFLNSMYAFIKDAEVYEVAPQRDAVPKVDNLAKQKQIADELDKTRERVELADRKAKRLELIKRYGLQRGRSMDIENSTLIQGVDGSGLSTMSALEYMRSLVAGTEGDKDNVNNS